MRYYFLILSFFGGILNAQTDSFQFPRDLRMRGNATENANDAIYLFNVSFQWYKDRKLLPHEEAAACLNNLGRQYAILEKYDSSAMYYYECLSMYRKLNSAFARKNLTSSLCNLGVMYQSKFEFDSANLYYNLALDRALLDPDVEWNEKNRILECIEELYREYDKIELLISFKNKLYVGKPAPDFSLFSNTGKQVTLKDYRGKWLLIDFWASWCYPCLKEIPTLKYIDTTLPWVEILGISVDTEYPSWISRIKSEDLTWRQVLDHQKASESTSIKYGARRIPLTVIIDPNGVVRRYGLRGEELKEALIEIGTEEGF